MTGAGTWSFETVPGRVEVAPDEIRVRKRLGRVAASSVRALASGRAPPVGRDVEWSAVAAGLGVLGAALEWIVGSGSGLGVVAFALATALAGIVVSAYRDARTEIPIRDVRRVEFRDGDAVVVRADDDAADAVVRPRSRDARNDAALAFRLRGIEVRGAADAEGVSRTVVDAPEADLVT